MSENKTPNYQPAKPHSLSTPGPTNKNMLIFITAMITSWQKNSESLFSL